MPNVKNLEPHEDAWHRNLRFATEVRSPPSGHVPKNILSTLPIYVGSLGFKNCVHTFTDVCTLTISLLRPDLMGGGNMESAGSKRKATHALRDSTKRSRVDSSVIGKLPYQYLPHCRSVSADTQQTQPFSVLTTKMPTAILIMMTPTLPVTRIVLIPKLRSHLILPHLESSRLSSRL